MPFVESISKYRSVSIIGMEKNCGKTVVLNYILSRLASCDRTIAVTSIGIDGETKDAVTNTAKPEITLQPNTLFATSESHYRQRRLISEIIHIGEDGTSLGKVIVARVIGAGKILLSGPGDTPSLKRLIDTFHSLGADLVIVDGALSRKSLASPSVTEGMILCTGAAVSLSIDRLVAQTKHTYDLISLPLYCEDDAREDEIHIAGMLTDRMLEGFINQTKCIVVKDFTKLFITAALYKKFTATQGVIKVLSKSELIAICVNPLSPTGYKLDSEVLSKRLSKEIGVDVYDVMNRKW